MNTTDTAALLPCPFCGGTLGFAGVGHKDGCYIPMAISSFAFTREQYDEAWNRRAPTPQTDGATVALTDEQIIERCKAAGIKWVPPELPDDCDYEMGFPGSFDMVSMNEMRHLLAATHAPAMAVTQVPEGFALVPTKPNDAMQLAGAEAVRVDTTALNRIWTANAVFRAMVAAAASGGEQG